MKNYGRINPSKPCIHLPGSAEKIACMMARAEKGLPLFHVEDARNDVQEGGYEPRRCRVAGVEKTGGWWF